MCCITSRSIAQSALIDFSIIDRGNGKVQLNWNNPYENCIQLSIQRSFDSLKYFQTIFSAQSPSLPKNGFVYQTGNPEVKIYFRIFYVLQTGDYYFTRSKSYSTLLAQQSELNQISTSIPEEINIDDIPFLSRKRRVNSDIITADYQNSKINSANPSFKPIEKKIIHIFNRKKDSLIQIMEYTDYKRFKDSITGKTKDTLYAINKTEVILLPYIPKYVWHASTRIYTLHNGYININIGEAKQHHYRILFYEEDGSMLFEIAHLKEPELTLDKANFMHAGWFLFEIFEEGKLIEKNKLYLDKEF